MAGLALAAVALVTVGLMFTAPLLAPIVPAVTVYLYLFERAGRLADEYVTELASAAPNPFGPRPLYRPWYADRTLAGFLQRITRDVSLYRAQADPRLEALRKRALRASWEAPLAAMLTFGGLGFLEFTISVMTRSR